MLMKMLPYLLLLCVLLAGCRETGPDVLPTLAEPDAIATSLVLTQYAPPPGFDTVAFPRIDANLNLLAGWRYEMTFAFNGVYARTTRAAATTTSASVTFNQLGSARRVVTTIDDDLEEASDPLQYEGVRLGPDTFLVRNSACVRGGEQAELLADLSAGDLLGGVRVAQTAAQIATINGEQVWKYNFTFDDLVLPTLRFTSESVVRSLSGELWVAPQHQAVVRYYLTMEVENVGILQQTLPVSGTIALRYDLYEVGTVPNIVVPFGC